MNGWELERLLNLIDENAEENSVRLRDEIVSYIDRNEDAVVAQLRTKNIARIPTSFGDFLLNLGDLRNQIFNPIAA